MVRGICTSSDARSLLHVMLSRKKVFCCLLRRQETCVRLLHALKVTSSQHTMICSFPSLGCGLIWPVPI